MSKVRQVKREHEVRWLGLPGVTAVGIGLTRNERPGIIISCEQLSPELSSQIPEELDGVPIELQASGPIRAG